MDVICKKIPIKKVRIRINKTEFFQQNSKYKTWNPMVWQHEGGKNIWIHFWPDPFLNHKKTLHILSLFCRESSLFNLIDNATDPDHFVQMALVPHQIEKLDPDPHQSEKQDPDPHQG
jgi:hypothetical protein